jgi:hypothetical protein
LAIKDTLKKQFLFDVIVIGVIIVVVIVAFLISRSGSVGWEIEKKSETVQDEGRTISENVYVHNKGNLEIISSTITFDLESEISIWLEGDVSLDIDDSVLKSSGNTYTYSLYAEDGKSPTMTVKNSDLIDHYGIFLQDNSKLESENSILGRVVMIDNSVANIKNSEVYLTLDSDKKEEYSGLSAGLSKNFQLESREGWVINLEDSEVTGYRINIDEGDEVFIHDFSDVSMLFSISRGDNENFLTLPSLSTQSSGSLDDLGFSMIWEDSKFEGFGFVLEDSSIKVQNTAIEDILLTDSELEVRESSIDCTLCSILDSTFDVNTATFTPNIQIYAYGGSKLEISNSDIQNIKISLYGSSELILKNCQYKESNIENFGEGSIEIL